MASLHRQKRSPYWYAALAGPDGTRQFKSTKTADRKLAMKIAVEWEELATAGKQGTLVAAQARKVVAEITELATGHPLQFKSVEEFLNSWVAGRVGARAEATLFKYRQAVREFLGHLGKRAVLPLNAIGSSDCIAFRDRCTGLGRTPSSVTNLLKCLSAAFESAKKEGSIPHNPWNAVPVLKDPEKRRRQVFTPQQIRALIDAASESWRGLILFGYFTGLRLQDIVNLKWENLDIESGMLRITARKTNKDVTLALHPDLRGWLEVQKKLSGEGYVLEELKNKSATHLSRSFTRFMGRAGVTGELIRKAKGNSGHNLSGLTFHSLRHTFISAMANAGVSEELRMEIVGQATGAVHKIYTHHEAERLRAAITTIPSLL
jgi:integrase